MVSPEEDGGHIPVLLHDASAMHPHRKDEATGQRFCHALLEDGHVLEVLAPPAAPAGGVICPSDTSH